MNQEAFRLGLISAYNEKAAEQTTTPYTPPAVNPPSSQGNSYSYADKFKNLYGGVAKDMGMNYQASPSGGETKQQFGSRLANTGQLGQGAKPVEPSFMQARQLYNGVAPNTKDLSISRDNAKYLGQDAVNQLGHSAGFKENPNVAVDQRLSDYKKNWELYRANRDSMPRPEALDPASLEQFDRWERQVEEPYQTLRKNTVGDADVLKGINQSLGNKTYNVASLDQQGQSHFKPMDFDFKRLWQEHPGAVVGGIASLIGIPALLHYMMKDDKQQQQPIIINTGGGGSTRGPMAFDKY